MKPVLVLVDLQADFLDRPGLAPPPQLLVERCRRLLEGCRGLAVPVLHAHTLVRPDGANRMPHWQRNGHWACVEGTPGCRPPEALAPGHGEPVFHKTFFSAFGDPAVDDFLRRAEADTVIVSGVYLHGCVRETVLDAYERGYEVWVASDAVASTEPMHSEISRAYLDGRAAAFLPADEILARLGSPGTAPRAPRAEVVPGACVGGEWIRSDGRRRSEQRNPARWDEVLAEVPIAGPDEARRAAAAAREAQRGWRARTPAERARFLESWADGLARRADGLARLLALEVGKPVTEGGAEIRRAIALVRAASRLAAGDGVQGIADEPAVAARRCPVGVVALVTPWNNPVAIPAGKLAPALAFGNGVVWKPPVQAPRTAIAVMESLAEAGAPPGLVNMVFGDGGTARHLIAEPGVGAVSLTGSIDTGRQVAALCTRLGKPLQAELGGNNAAIVMSDLDPRPLAGALAASAFGFAGQRCTATRRFIVEESIGEGFAAALASAISALRVGDPVDPATEVGPLVSRHAQARVGAAVDEAVRDGAALLAGGSIPEALGHGCWYRPTLLRCDEPRARIVQEETFGPVAVIQGARDFEAALELCNGVPQGLVASLHTRDEAVMRRFLEGVEAGVVRVNRALFEVHAQAPFGGWKASGIGPPEHGTWDREFYSRPQALYGWGAGGPA